MSTRCRALDFDTPDAGGAEQTSTGLKSTFRRCSPSAMKFKSIAQRVQAEFENFRKQASIRAQADADRATGRLAEAFLPVLDAAEAAFLRHPDEVGPLLNQMLDRAQEARPRNVWISTANRSIPKWPRLWRTSLSTVANRSWPRCCAADTSWKGKTLRAADGEDHGLRTSHVRSASRVMLKSADRGGERRMAAQRDWFEKDFYEGARRG